MLDAIFFFHDLMQSMKKKNNKKKSSKSEGECKPSQACLCPLYKRKQKRKNKSLDHGLLLMLFFSCKRKKIEQKSLFMFCTYAIIYVYMLYEDRWAALKLELKDTPAPRHCYAEQTHDWRHSANAAKRQGQQRKRRTGKKRKKKTEWEPLCSPADLSFLINKWNTGFTINASQQKHWTLLQECHSCAARNLISAKCLLESIFMSQITFVKHNWWLPVNI